MWLIINLAHFKSQISHNWEHKVWYLGRMWWKWHQNCSKYWNGSPFQTYSHKTFYTHAKSMETCWRYCIVRCFIVDNSAHSTFDNREESVHDSLLRLYVCKYVFNYYPKRVHVPMSVFECQFWRHFHLTFPVLSWFVNFEKSIYIDQFVENMTFILNHTVL